MKTQFHKDLAHSLWKDFFKGSVYKNKKRQEFSSHAVTALLLDADSPGTNRVVIKILIKHPTDQSFYL